MNWELDKNRPICPQICERLCVDIAQGTFESGQRLYSVRELALRLGVNPNTVQKAFEQLETQGLIYSVRGSGWYVGEKSQTTHRLVDSLAHEKTATYLEQMLHLGYTLKDVRDYLKEWTDDE